MLFKSKKTDLELVTRFYSLSVGSISNVPSAYSVAVTVTPLCFHYACDYVTVNICQLLRIRPIRTVTSSAQWNVYHVYARDTQ